MVNPAMYTILIVDDTKNNLFALRTLLEASINAEVVEASSGVEALEKVLLYNIDLILLDVQMPEMNGFEVAKFIRNRKRYQDIPIIFLTAVYKSEEFKQQGLKGGAIDYLTKPIDDDILINRVKAYLRLLESERTINRELAHINTRLEQEIEERRRAEKALAAERALLAHKVDERTAELSEANAELKRAARLKDEFLATMSHELRTPLNIILGMSEALQEQVYGDLGDNQLQVIHTIKKSGHHLLELINDILDFSNIITGKTELEILPVSIESVIQLSLRSIEHTANEKHLSVSVAHDAKITTMYTDEIYLQKMLIHLVDNAVKFTPEGGEIGVTVEKNMEKNLIDLTIWDTGIGIAAEDIDRLFQPFVQLDSKLSRKYPGTGLGLALVYRIVEMLGGSIAVDSEIGKGSRFTVSLPWQEKHHEHSI